MSEIDQIRERIDIVELISEYVPDLKKAGRNYRALCPFHSEKTPSFFVFPDRQTWHCFGSCATGGDIFAFVMKKENVDFGDALRILAHRAGFTLSMGKKIDATDKVHQELYDINKKAADYYHQFLLTSPAAEPVRNYLTKRGVSADSIENFYLGYSPDSWDTIKNILVSQGMIKQGLTTGLLIEKDGGGGYYDRFRGHLMFPIRNTRGHIVGFGARVLDNSLPKYINSPQSPVFDKSSELYGIDLAHTTISKLKQVVIVEGYMDVIIAHQYGFGNVVASMGTALNDRQISTLRKLTKNFVLAMDSDEAGKNAARKGLESAWLTMENVVNMINAPGGKRTVGGHYYDEELKIAPMPLGKDPDEVIKEDKNSWQTIIDKAQNWPDYLIDIIVPEIDPNDARSKSGAVNKVLPFLSAIPDPIERAHYLQKLARLVGVNEETLISATNKLKNEFTSRIGKTHTGNSMRQSIIGNPCENYCLSLLLCYPRLRDKSEQILPDYFSHTVNRELFLYLKKSSNSKTSLDDIEPALKEQLDYLTKSDMPPMSDKEVNLAFVDCVRHLREQHLRDLKLKEALLFSDPEIIQNSSDMEVIEQKGLTHNTQLRDIFNQHRE